MVTIFLLGIVIAWLIDELTGLTPGGYIVPGYLALEMTEPIRLGVTLALTIVVVALLRGLRRVILLYGRRKLGFAILTGAVIKGILAKTIVFFQIPVGILVIGYVIPGLVADRCDKQGVVRTLFATCVATCTTYLIAFVIIG